MKEKHRRNAFKAMLNAVEVETEKERLFSGWLPISEAPRDGTEIDITWFDAGFPHDICRMKWGHIQRNGLFPGRVGMWVTECGKFTWDESGGHGPTHFRRVK